MSERKGIPTMYEGVLMRSRTEARWAALFDDLGWEWAYEPIDLPGWIPDFVLSFPYAPLLVEIKSTGEDFREAMAKADRSGHQGEIVILGFDLGLVANEPESVNSAGHIREIGSDYVEWYQVHFFECLSCGQPSIKSFEGSWRCRVCGVYHGNAHVGDFDMKGAWKRAGNRVQWNPPEAA